MFWVLAAFGLVVIDRDCTGDRLAAAAAARDAEQDSDDGVGPKLGMRWLLVTAGGCLGAATACKWNAVWYIAAFTGLVILWDLGARRADGLPGALARGAPQRRAVAAAVVRGAARRRLHRLVDRLVRHSPTATTATAPPSTTAIRCPRSRPGWEYNRWTLQYGLGLHQPQTYQSNPLDWLILARPISFYSSCLPAKACGAPAPPSRRCWPSARRCCGGAPPPRSCSAWRGG